MVMRPLPPCGALLFGAIFTIAAILIGPQRALAEPLDEEGCLRLESEREALTVLGIDKYFENGVEWAKANLTVADLNLVKRYLNVYEQLKFRCKQDIDIVEDDETAASGPVPPLPEKNPKQSGQAAATKRPRLVAPAAAAETAGGKSDKNAVPAN